MCQKSLETQIDLSADLYNISSGKTDSDNFCDYGISDFLQDLIGIWKFDSVKICEKGNPEI